MLRRAIELRIYLHEFIDKNYNDLGDDVLSHDDWDLLKETALFLQPFYEATQATQGDEDTLDQTLVTMDFLIAHLRSAKAAYVDNPAMNSSVLTAWFVFDKYYNLTDETPAYAAALILHPSFKTQYLHAN